MTPATQALADALAEVELTMPRIDVYANTTGKPYSSVEEIRLELQKQVGCRVAWRLDGALARVSRWL
jgi:malonyl CoA-acyl carrier protein transacylase